jgi:hypothetical protein
MPPSAESAWSPHGWPSAASRTRPAPPGVPLPADGRGAERTAGPRRPGPRFARRVPPPSITQRRPITSGAPPSALVSSSPPSCAAAPLVVGSPTAPRSPLTIAAPSAAALRILLQPPKRKTDRRPGGTTPTDRGDRRGPLAALPTVAPRPHTREGRDRGSRQRSGGDRAGIGVPGGSEENQRNDLREDGRSEGVSCSPAPCRVLPPRKDEEKPRTLRSLFIGRTVAAEPPRSDFPAHPLFSRGPHPLSSFGVPAPARAGPKSDRNSPPDLPRCESLSGAMEASSGPPV